MAEATNPSIAESSSNEKGIIEKVNGSSSASISSLGTPLRSNTSSPSPRKKSVKEVSFSECTPEKNDDVLNLPQTLSKDEISAMGSEDIAKLVLKLQEKIVQLKVDYSAEKVLRKKKEKNLLKLAKQLNVNATDVDDKKKQIQQLIASQATLETRLEDYKNSLESMQLESSRTTLQYHAEISDLQGKNRALQNEHQDTVTKMSLENGKRVEDLRRQVLESQLETDRLRVQLASLQMKREGGSEKGTEKIIRRTLREHDQETEKVFFCSVKFWRIVGIFFGAILIPSIAIAHEMDLLSRSAVCSPAMPGTYLDSEMKGDFTFDAPWWVLSSMKKTTFRWFCHGRRRTRINWIPSNKPDQFKLVVIDLNKVDEGKSGKGNNGQVFERKAASITLHSDSITYENNKGNKPEKRRAPWVPSRNLLLK